MDKNFREKVLEAVKSIPYGKVASYGQIALIAGAPRGAREVGWILHSAGQYIPWWRVINNKGYISIRNDPELAQEQKNRLMEEEVEVDENFNIDIKRYRWVEEP